MRKPYNLNLDTDLMDRVDAEAGDVPRSRFVERVLEAALGGPAVPIATATNVEGDGTAPRPASPRTPAKEPVAETPLPKIAKRHWA